jgi:hypothetical protein
MPLFNQSRLSAPVLDCDASAEGVFSCVDILPASERLEDRRASVPPTLRLREHISAVGFKGVPDVAEGCAVRKNDLPIGARSRKQRSAQLSSAEGPAGHGDAQVASGDLARILGVTDTRLQTVDRVHAWIRKGSVHGLTPG